MVQWWNMVLGLAQLSACDQALARARSAWMHRVRSGKDPEIALLFMQWWQQRTSPLAHAYLDFWQQLEMGVSVEMRADGTTLYRVP